MDYVGHIRDHSHPSQEVAHGRFFSDLNDVRVGIKHKGLFPDPMDWKRVASRTWEHISELCSTYLSLALEDLDQSALIANPTVMTDYKAAKAAAEIGNYKLCLEELGRACYSLFRSNQALRNLTVGTANAEDAIKLSAFGVHANDYLALQEFLPSARRAFTEDEPDPHIRWDQKKYGHPGNWTQSNAEFCLRTFVEVVLQIQHARWIPGAIEFSILYRYKLTALIDGVEIKQQFDKGLINHGEVVVRTLRAGDSVTCEGLATESVLAAGLRGTTVRRVTIQRGEDGLWGTVELDKVKITCIPHDYPTIKEYFPDLKEIDYEE
jgi:hypothetical protein